MFDVIVIGGGAAGSIAAAKAASGGKRVCLLERNSRIGRKLLITGKGRCNFTNASEVSEHLANCPVNGKFVTNALHRLTPENLINFFEELGVKHKVERGQRVFPDSDKAEDIVKALEIYLQQNNVVLIQERVKNLAKINGKFVLLGDSGKRYEADKIIIATGGKSYSRTGSTGDGYMFAQKLGHKINLLKPSLVPIETEESWVKKAEGLTLRNISIKILNKNDKTLYSDFGELTFMSYGISGPVILSASSYIRVINNLTLEIDLKPALEEDVLDKRLLREIQENSNSQYKTVLKNLLPQQLLDLFVEFTDISADRKANTIRKDERKRLLHFLKHLRLTLKRFRPIEEAIITSGGVCVEEINPLTMESKIEPNLFFAGEIIDVDAYTGGYNLQIAFSTGYTAGDNCRLYK